MKWIRPLLHVLAYPYGCVIRIRNLLYDRGWKRQDTLPCRVISVGNLTVGRTGKTPVIIWLAEQLQSQGFRLGVLSRGYRRRGRTPQLLVSDGRAILADPLEAGDEPHLIARRCPGAVVAVGADRYRLGRWVLDRFALDYLLLDDGFQHRSLSRDVDLVLVDASDQSGLRALLPVGRLREPLSSLRRASAVLITRVEEDADVHRIRALLREHGTDRLDAIPLRFDAEALIHVAKGNKQALDAAAGRPALIFSGIGNAGSFRRLLARHGIRIEDEIVFSDHHAYAHADLESVRMRTRRCGAELMITTEKDAVKIAAFIRPEEPMWAARLRTDIIEGRERLERLVMGGWGGKRGSGIWR